MTPEEIASDAQRILESPVYQAAIEDLQAESYDLIKNSPPDGADERESAYRDIRAIQRIHARLESHMSNLELLKRKKIRSI